MNQKYSIRNDGETWWLVFGKDRFSRFGDTELKVYIHSNVLKSILLVKKLLVFGVGMNLFISRFQFF